MTRGGSVVKPNPRSMFQLMRWARTEGDPQVARIMTFNMREALKAKLHGKKLF